MDKIQMYHPTKMRNGKRVIQSINPKTVKSGKAEKMGYVAVEVPEIAPTVKPKAPVKPKPE